MRHPRRLILTAIALLIALTTSAGPTVAANKIATNVFYGVATSGAPDQPFKVNVDCSQPNTVDDKGTVSCTYIYTAEGKMTGDLPGTSTYLEQGHIFLNQGKVVGGQTISAVFTLTPYGTCEPFPIPNTEPEKLQHQPHTVSASELPRHVLRYLSLLFNKDMEQLRRSGSLTYESFTFTIGEDKETFTGYATPDYGRIVIALTFPVPATCDL